MSNAVTPPRASINNNINQKKLEKRIAELEKQLKDNEEKNSKDT